MGLYGFIESLAQISELSRDYFQQLSMLKIPNQIETPDQIQALVPVDHAIVEEPLQQNAIVQERLQQPVVHEVKPVVEQRPFLHNNPLHSRLTTWVAIVVTDTVFVVSSLAK